MENIKKYLVERPTDSVVVSILKNKDDGTYSFVNLTKGHICTCRFNSEEEAIADMDSLIEQGKIIRYNLL